MKTVRLAALLVALAGRAWAANDGKPQPYTGPVMTLTDRQAFEVCKASETPSGICAMKYVSEDDALAIALTSLKDCSTGVAAYQALLDAECPATRAYIRQRWGY